MKFERANKSHKCKVNKAIKKRVTKLVNELSNENFCLTEIQVILHQALTLTILDDVIGSIEKGLNNFIKDKTFSEDDNNYIE